MLITLEKELENVKAYLTLVQTRFPNKYSIHFQIEPNLEEVTDSSIYITAVVENAINYGFPGSKDGGNHCYQVFSKKNQLHIMLMTTEKEFRRKK